MERVISMLESRRKDIIISFRLKSEEERDLLQAKADQSNLKVSEFLRKCISGQEIKENNNQRGLIAGLVDDMRFMLEFFQNNADNLKINASEMERFRKILQKLKELREK